MGANGGGICFGTGALALSDGLFSYGGLVKCGRTVAIIGKVKCERDCYAML